MSQVGALGMATEGASATQILTHFYRGVRVQPRRDNVAIAVNIAHNIRRIQFHSQSLATGGGAVVVTTIGADGVHHWAGGPADVWTVSVIGSGLTLRQGRSVVARKARDIEVRWAGTPNAPHHLAKGYNRGAATAIALRGHTYRYGQLGIYAHSTPNAHAEVVNTLNLHDEYLRGLGEVPSSWPKAALAAQVDAARSYALVKYDRGIQPLCDCHLDSGTGPFQDQNFVGYSKETSAGGGRWVAAIAATQRGHWFGQTVTYQGVVAQTFYFASSGGRTEDAAAVWGTAVPYLRSVDDHWSTETRYNPTFAQWGPLTRSEQSVAAVFGLPDVTAIARHRSSAGVVTLTATSSRGRTSSVSGATLARRLNLTSIWIRHAAPRR